MTEEQELVPSAGRSRLQSAYYVEKRTEGLQGQAEGTTIYYLRPKRGGRSHRLGRLREFRGLPVVDWTQVLAISKLAGLSVRTVALARGLQTTVSKRDWDTLSPDELQRAHELICRRPAFAGEGKEAVLEWGRRFCLQLKVPAKPGSPLEDAREAIRLVIGAIEATRRSGAARGAQGIDEKVDEARSRFNDVLCEHSARSTPFLTYAGGEFRLDYLEPVLRAQGASPALLSEFISWLEAGASLPVFGVCENCSVVYVKKSGQNRRRFCSDTCRAKHNRDE